MSIQRRRVALPGDEYACAGCGQHLAFDERGFVADAQLRACQSRCDWTLLCRAGRAVPLGSTLAGR
jgi:hypothetical protein